MNVKFDLAGRVTAKVSAHEYFLVSFKTTKYTVFYFFVDFVPNCE